MTVPEHLGVLNDGKDARTDAIVDACAASPSEPELHGISEVNAPGMLARCSRFLGGVSLVDVDRTVEFVREAERPIGLAIIGPEEPLAAGLVDRLEDELDIPCFGPRRDLARIETSKTWARQLLDTYRVPGNPEYRIFRSPARLRNYLGELGEFVLKPDGLTGGKGVRVFPEHFTSVGGAMAYAHELLENDGVVLVEQRLDGEEFSLQSITDGETVVHCPVVQDHKRASEGDTGPNTGGMGSYSDSNHSLPFLSSEDVELAQSINEQVVRSLRTESGRPYRGVLYGGFMATANGVKLIEYNARFGDPEAMNVIPALDADLLEVCWNTAIGELGSVAVQFANKATVCKYVVPEAYPSGKGAGDEIHVDPPNASDPNVRMYWAAVNKVDSRLLMTGSRALAFVGLGDTLEQAEAHAETATNRVRGPVRHRSDIGRESVIEKRVTHMAELRGHATPNE